MQHKNGYKCEKAVEKLFFVNFSFDTDAYLNSGSESI